jgi:hypothetical protein
MHAVEFAGHTVTIFHKEVLYLLPSVLASTTQANEFF